MDIHTPKNNEEINLKMRQIFTSKNHKRPKRPKKINEGNKSTFNELTNNNGSSIFSKLTDLKGNEP